MLFRSRSGKTTQINRLYKYLSATGLKILLTREPWDEETRNKIKHTPLPPRTQLDLIIADRINHCEFIRQSLETHDLVLCDRFTQSSIAYQCYGGGLDVYQTNKANEIATRGLVPDLVLIFDCPIASIYQRGTGSSSVPVIMRDWYYLEMVRWGYMNIANKNNYPVINSLRSEDEVFKEVLNKIKPILTPELVIQ